MLCIRLGLSVERCCNFSSLRTIIQSRGGESPLSFIFPIITHFKFQIPYTSQNKKKGKEENKVCFNSSGKKGYPNSLEIG